MKFSYFMPNMMEGRFAKMGTITWDTMLERAQAVEDLGYDGIWLGEFIETQKDIATGFPGEHPHNYAPLTTMTALAMATKSVRLTTAVVVLPYHDPLILGREMATLDTITNGRITLGVGLGGEAGDYRRTRQQLGAVNRSRMMDECLAAMRALWTEPKSSYHGSYYAFDDVDTFPKPAQHPFPVYVAGRVDATLRRVAQHGQGWIEVTLDPQNIALRRDLLRKYLDEAGRSGERVEIARQCFMSIGATDDEAQAYKDEAIVYNAPSVARRGIAKAATEGHERLIVGSVDHVRARVHAYAEAGVTELCLSLYEPDAAAAIRQLELFADRIMPDFR